MIIRLSSEFIDNIFSDNLAIKKDVVSFINQCLYSVRNHEHVILCDDINLNKIIKSPDFSEIEHEIAINIKKYKQDIYSIFNKITVFIEPTISLNKCENELEKTKFCINITDKYSLKSSVCSTENTDDFTFYEIVSKTINKENLFSFHLENFPFGGGAAKKCLKNFNKNKLSVLAIADSDKRYEGFSGHVTADDVLKAEKERLMKHIPFSSYILNVHEKENLLPLTFYKFKDSEKKKLISCISKTKNEELFKYFDIKSGIKCKRYYENDSKWDNLYTPFLEQYFGDDYKNHFKCEKACSDICEIRCDKIVISGVGADFETKYKDFFKKYKKVKDNKPFKNQGYLFDEWIRIYFKMFEYGCCFADNINF